MSLEFIKGGGGRPPNFTLKAGVEGLVPIRQAPLISLPRIFLIVFQGICRVMLLRSRIWSTFYVRRYFVSNPDPDPDSNKLKQKLVLGWTRILIWWKLDQDFVIISWLDPDPETKCTYLSLNAVVLLNTLLMYLCWIEKHGKNILNYCIIMINFNLFWFFPANLNQSKDMLATILVFLWISNNWLSTFKLLAAILL